MSDDNIALEAWEQIRGTHPTFRGTGITYVGGVRHLIIYVSDPVAAQGAVPSTLMGLPTITRKSNIPETLSTR